MPYNIHEIMVADVVGGGKIQPGAIVEIRCACGQLIIRGAVGVIGTERINQALDRHLIGVLEYQWVRQFYQEKP